MKKKINIDRSKIELCIAFFFISFAIYFPKIFDILPNPDAIWNSTIYKTSYGWEVSLGRYFIAFFQMLRGNVVNTSFISILCMIYLALICVLVVDILNIHSRLWQLMTGILLIISPHIGSVLTYYYCSDMYMFSYLLSVLVVWILVRKHSRWSIIVSMLLIMSSLAIYQAYLGVTIALCFLYLLLMIFTVDLLAADIIRQTARFVFSGIGGVLLYLVSNKVIQKCLNITATEDRGFSTMGLLNFSDIPMLLKDCYRFFYHYFFSNVMLYNDFGRRNVINFVFVGICLILAVFFMAGKQLTIYRKVACVALAILLPVAFTSIVIMAPEVSVLGETGILMMSAMNYVYIFVVIFLEKFSLPHESFKVFLNAIAFSCCTAVVLTLLNLELAGQTYMKYNMMKTGTVANHIIAQVEKYVDNSENYKLCIIGNMEKGNYPEQYPQLHEVVKWTSAYHKTIWTNYFATQSCWMAFFRDFCGKNYNFASQDDYKKIAESNILETMQNFPDTGSIVVTDELVIVIKLSDASW